MLALSNKINPACRPDVHASPLHCLSPLLLGGAIWAQQVEQLAVSESTFSGNTADLMGGAISMSYCEAANVNKTIFDSNSAAYGAGAIRCVRARRLYDSC